jgi:branched-chain amino acid transport system ATP-binding protein
MMPDVFLSLKGIRKNFGESEIISGVDLAVFQGERHAIIGPNGAGKSTLFNLISGLYPVSEGKIELNGRDVTGFSPHKINRLGLSRSFQTTNIFPQMSIFENIRCALLWYMGVVFDLADRISVLVYGEIIATDTPDAIRQNPKVREAYLGREAG